MSWCAALARSNSPSSDGRANSAIGSAASRWSPRACSRNSTAFPDSHARPAKAQCAGGKSTA
eukprot:804981-Pyramimonas_sp.AAC.1